MIKKEQKNKTNQDDRLSYNELPIISSKSKKAVANSTSGKQKNYYFNNKCILSSEHTKQWSNMNIHDNLALKNIPLESVGLSVRPFNSLKRAKINTVYDLCLVIQNNSFSTIRNIGDQSIEEIIEKTDKFLSTCNVPLGSIGTSSSSTETTAPSAEASTQEFNHPAMGIISDLPLSLLNGYFGEQMVEGLLSIDIKTIGDLHNLLIQYRNFITPGIKLLDKSLQLLTLQIRRLLDQGKISSNCFIATTPLLELLSWIPAEENKKIAQIHYLRQIVEAQSLTHEITQVFNDLTERQKQIFLDCSLHGLTLEEEAKKQVPTVTRERIRQILSEATTKLRRNLDKNLKIYIQTAFEMATELGTSLSQETWKVQLIERKILTDADQNHRSFDFFCALVKDKQTSQNIYGVPESVKTTLKNLDSQPLYVSKYLESDSKENLRRVKRIVNYTGGVDLRNAAQVMGCTIEEVAGILKSQGITEIIPGWFSYSAKTELDSKASLFRAGLIMTQTCGTLNFESFCDGLRRYISRHFDTLAPAEVIKHVLNNFGFKIENNFVSYAGEIEVRLSNSDMFLLELLQEKGPVLSFQDLVEFYQEKGLSFSTATTRVMPDSPILEKVDYALYKLRGSVVSQQDMDTAKARQDETARNIEIIFGSDRIIRYRSNLGSWALGGVLSISRSLPPLPDFSEGWPIYVGEEQIGTASRDELLIWGLASAFQKLGAKVGDRVELAFDQRKTKRISVRIIESNR